MHSFQFISTALTADSGSAAGASWCWIERPREYSNSPVQKLSYETQWCYLCADLHVSLKDRQTLSTVTAGEISPGSFSVKISSVCFPVFPMLVPFSILHHQITLNEFDVSSDHLLRCPALMKPQQCVISDVRLNRTSA